MRWKKILKLIFSWFTDGAKEIKKKWLILQQFLVKEIISVLFCYKNGKQLRTPKSPRITVRKRKEIRARWLVWKAFYSFLIASETCNFASRKSNLLYASILRLKTQGVKKHEHLLRPNTNWLIKTLSCQIFKNI